MLVTHSPIPRKSTTNRSAITNGTRLLEGVDGRSPTARRYRDLATAYADELGGEAAMTETEKALARQAAALTVQSETMQGSIVRGEAIDAEQLTRLCNSVTRILNSLRRKSRVAKQPTAHALADYLATKARGAVAP